MSAPRLASIPWAGLAMAQQACVVRPSRTVALPTQFGAAIRYLTVEGYSVTGGYDARVYGSEGLDYEGA